MNKAFPFVAAAIGAAVSILIVVKVPQIVTYAFVGCSIITLYLVGKKNNPFK